MWIANAARCREIDCLAQSKFGATSEDLMRRAGEAVFHVALGMMPARRRMAIVCGKGNNGGDGFVVATLAKRRGLEVACFVAAPRESLSVDAGRECTRAEEAGCFPVFVGTPGWLEGLDSYDLIVDALLGTGTSGAVGGATLEAIQAIRTAQTPVVSVDVPSGIDCDTGASLGAHVVATKTVTFGLPKPCFFQGDGLEACGEWSLADIGFPKELLEEGTGIRLLDASWVRERLPVRTRNSHKGANGRVLIVAGSHRMPGAAVLSAKGALRAGAGLVTVAACDSVCAAVASQVPEATLLPLSDLGESDARAVSEHPCDAAVFGPGLTTSPKAVGFLRTLWSQWSVPCCLDADALNAIAQGAIAPACQSVMTPHPGELGRLLREEVAAIQSARFASARRAGESYGLPVLLKGASSVVAAPGQDLLVNATGNPGMAAAGMGDVLSGVIATLLAQGLEPTSAAACGAFLHGAAGDLCGPPGFTASELAARLPEARAKIKSA